MSDAAIADVVVRATGGFDDPDPVETSRRGLVLADDVSAGTIGLLGVGPAGSAAVVLAARSPEIPRLVLVNVPFDPDTLGVDPTDVHARVLLLFGARDPATGSAHGRKWQRALPSARLEMVPDGDADLVGRMWSRALSHLAPGRTRAR